MRTAIAAISVLSMVLASSASHAQPAAGGAPPKSNPAKPKPADPSAVDAVPGDASGKAGDASGKDKPTTAKEPAVGQTPSAPDPAAKASPKPELPAGHPPVNPGTPLPTGHPTTAPPKKTRNSLPPIPLAPPRLFPVREGEKNEEIVGIHGGRVFIRDPHDTYRFYPGGWAALDFHSAPGAPDLRKADGSGALSPSFGVRRVRLELSGELFRRVAYTVGVEIGGQRIGNTSLAGDDFDRFAPASGHDGQVLPAEVSVSYRFRRWLNFTAGNINAPFSMANRTRDWDTPFMERNIAIRGLVVPNQRELGLTVWGDILPKHQLSYELGIFSGDGPTRPVVDARPDLIGRIYSRPLASLGDSTFFEKAQIGISMRHGEKDQNKVSYDYPTIATNQGFAMWQPGYRDSLDRLNRVIPSGAQNAIGGELRLPFDLPHGALDIRAEGYYVVNNTREGIEEFQQDFTQRFGRVKGLGWYAMVSYWAMGDAFVSGDPGVYRPVTVDLDKPAPALRGLEIQLLASGIAANYNGATRQQSVADPNTPESNIALYQFGAGLNFWYSRNFRASLNYLMYFAPDAGDVARNQAFVPDNLVVSDGLSAGGQLHQELGGRLAVGF